MKKLEKIIFILIFILILFFVKNLLLYVDDFSFGLGGPPYLTRELFSFAKEYFNAHGLFRPLALVYYYFIYSLYNFWPALSHTIPYLIPVIAGYLLFWILKKQGLNKALAILTGLIFVLHPFATEQYMWLSANPGTVTNLIFFIQIWLIESEQNKNKTLILVFVLSIISVLLYESTFFMFIPLSYLIYKKYFAGDKIQNFFKVLVINSIGIIIYIFSKVIFIGKNPRTLTDSIPLFIQHVSDMLNNFYITHFDNYYLNHFWSDYAAQGWNILVNSSLITIGFFIFFIVFLAVFVAGYLKPDEKITNSYLYFWTMAFIASLPPLLANKEFLFPFRSLFLPVILLIVIINISVQKLNGINTLYALATTSFISIIFFIVINITISNKYIVQYLEDMKLSNKISNVLEKEGLTNKESYIILKSEVSFDSRETFVRADHFLSCYFQEWSALPCLNIINKNVKAIAIMQQDGRITLQTNMSYDELLNKRPLIFLKYNKNRSLSVENIL